MVIRARAEVQDDLAQLVAELDQRRPQVLIEAAIVEISGDIAEQLGVQLGLGDAATNASFAATSFSDSGLALKNILTLLRVPVAPAITPTGLSIGLSTEDEYGILIQALAPVDQGEPALDPEHHHPRQPGGPDPRRPERPVPHRLLHARPAPRTPSTPSSARTSASSCASCRR